MTGSSPPSNPYLWDDMIDRWCQSLPSCASPSSPSVSSSSWWWPSDGILFKSKRVKDDDTAATASTTKEDSICGEEKRVSFGHVQVREYERCVDSSIYMGLSLGWDCVDLPPVPLPGTPSQDSSSTKRRRSQKGGDTRNACKKHNGERFALLLAYGMTRKELKKEVALAAKVWKQQQKEVILKEEKQLAWEKLCKREAKRRNGTMGKPRALLFSFLPPSGFS